MGSKLLEVSNGGKPHHSSKNKTSTNKNLKPTRSNIKLSDLDYFERRLDSKNRLTVPTELRSQFSGGKVIVTRGFGKYLHMYTEKVWDQIVEPRLTGDVLDERVADLNVQFRLGHQVSHMDDRQGRITLSQSLLDYAGVKKDIVAVRIGTSYWRLMSKKAAGIDSA